MFVILVPVVGGVIVGLMALYGSKAIRGHGIPEAMEQILTNESKIKPSITYLKPLSAAISIGTGGPFGAEGPIIATGGALGSTVGQLLKISHNERKILLAAGATAGMSAIFGSPIAAVFLAIELLLFEFSPRSIIPVTLACITGAAGHHFLFEAGPVFPMKMEEAPGNIALAIYSGIGVIIGLLAVGVTKIVYFIEDMFQKLPIHWMWWPAIGGLCVGAVGYYFPRTLGVGYNNITEMLSGALPFRFMITLCAMKFLSWAIALGSGTSGGTLAPLLTIGSATGALLGTAAQLLFPQVGVTISLAAFIGMSSLFAGASRALLTSIIFAIETTGQSQAILPLLASCAASYFISFLFMENTIMTEKIARRGVKTPESYEPDLLEKVAVNQVMDANGIILTEDNTIEEVKEWLSKETTETENFFVIASREGEYRGIISSSALFAHHQEQEAPVKTLIRRKNVSIESNDSLRSAVDLMATENIDVLPVLSANEKNIIGVLSYKNVISAYKHGVAEHKKQKPHISLNREGLKMLRRGPLRFKNKGKD
jgi:H+/Cl- antiporter ClcA